MGELQVEGFDQPIQIQGNEPTPEEARRILTALDKIKAKEQLITDPLPPAEPFIIPSDPKDAFFLPDQTGPVTLPRTEENLLRQQGIETRGQGAPVGRSRALFAEDQEREIEVLQQTLSNHFGTFTPVSLTESGELVFQNPETNRLELIDPKGFETGDISEFIDAAGPFVAEGAGGLAGGLTTKTPGGAVAGAATGIGVFEATKRGLGQAIGVREVSPEDIAAGGFTEAGIATVGGAAFIGLFRGIRALTKGATVVTPDELRIAMSNTNNADDVINNLRRRGFDVQANVGQRANMQSLMDELETVRRGSKNVALDEEARTIERRNTNELMRFFKEIHPSVSQTRRVAAGASVQREVRQGIRGAKQRAVAPGQRAATEADIEAGRIPEFDEPLAGKILRGEVNPETGEGTGLLIIRQAGQDIVNAKFVTVNQLANINEQTLTSNIKIPKTNISASAVRLLGSLSRKGLFKTKTGEILPRVKSGFKPAKKGEIIEVALEDGTPLRLNVKSKEIDIAVMNEWVKELNQAIRVSSKGLSTEAPPVGQLKLIRNALRKERDIYLKENNPELLRAIEEANHATRLHKNTFDRGVIGEILQVDEAGNFRLVDADAVRRVIRPRNREAAQQVADVLSGDIQAKQAFREQLLAFYKSEVFQDGKPVLKLHQRFMKQYGDTMRPFFRGRDAAAIKRFGNFSKVIERSAQRLKTVEQAIKHSTHGKIERMNSEALVRSFYDDTKTGFGVRDINRLVRVLEESDNKGLLNSFRASTSDELARRITTKGKLDSNKLLSLLESTGDDKGTGKLSMLFGNQYIADLKTLASALDVTTRKGRAFTKAGESTNVGGLLRRFFFKPLTVGVRRFTVAQIASGKAVDRAVFNGLMSPKDLRALVSILEKDINNDIVVGILGSLGATSLLEAE